MSRLFVIFISVITLADCQSFSNKITDVVLPDVTLEPETCVLPKRIDGLISRDRISEICDHNKQSIEVMPNHPNEMAIKGFFMWQDDIDGRNRGIFLSVERNRYTEYSLTYIEDVIERLKRTGEADVEGNTFLYEPWEGVGTSGAYNEKQSTYYWQLQECVLFKMVFNTNDTQKEQKLIACIIANEINLNYLNFIASKQDNNDSTIENQ